MKKLNSYFHWSAAAGIAVAALAGFYSLACAHVNVPIAYESASPLVHDGSYLVVPPNSPLRQALGVIPVAEEDIGAVFTLPAVVEADPARVVKVLTPAVGRIVTLDKRLGDAVKAGDLLFTVDSADLVQARADDAKARAVLTLARTNLARQIALEAADIAAQRDLEQARSDADQAVGEASRATARLMQLGSRSNGNMLAVRAPIAGRVVELATGRGANWNDTTAPVMVIADLERVVVTANAPEKNIGLIAEGQAVKLNFDAFTGEMVARVGTLGWMLDADTRTVKVRIPVNNQALRMRPGMFATARFSAPTHRGILVPLAGIVQDGISSRTFVEVAPWRFESRTVVLGTQVGERVEVTSGLADGERIVVKDGVLLND